MTDSLARIIAGLLVLAFSIFSLWGTLRIQTVWQTELEFRKADKPGNLFLPYSSEKENSTK
jgi:hypothetical protein